MCQDCFLSLLFDLLAVLLFQHCSRILIKHQGGSCIILWYGIVGQKHRNIRPKIYWRPLASLAQIRPSRESWNSTATTFIHLLCWCWWLLQNGMYVEWVRIKRRIGIISAQCIQFLKHNFNETGFCGSHRQWKWQYVHVCHVCIVNFIYK